MRILLLPRYGVRGASSRYRLWQYAPLWERAGHEVEVQPLMDDGYLGELYGTGRRGWRWLAAGYARRLRRSVRLRGWGPRPFDAVICEQEGLPFLPALAEKVFQGLGRQFILDYDDAAYVKYERWPWLRNKIPRLMAGAKAVVAGNGCLADYARRFNSQVHVIPTVVNLDSYPVKEDYAARPDVRVVWIGTPMTAPFLNSVVPVLSRLQRRYPRVKFRFIGADGGLSRDGLRVETPEWSEHSEARLLAECDIGIMPLPEEEFARGKCGLKLIQYMACGLPVVASPVGANLDIVAENETGFLAGDSEGWYEKLSLLIERAELRQRLGQSGRARVAEQYSLELGFSRWLEVLNGVAPDRDHPGLEASGKAYRNRIEVSTGR